ncbi:MULTISPECIES: LrgB family protein, partial [Phocaeicola]
MEYLENKFFLLAFTFGVFFLSRVLQKKTGWVVLNPILLTIAVLILFLKFTGISYEIYLKSATKPLNVLIAFTRPLITEFAD